MTLLRRSDNCIRKRRCLNKARFNVSSLWRKWLFTDTRQRFTHRKFSSYNRPDSVYKTIWPHVRQIPEVVASICAPVCVCAPQHYKDSDWSHMCVLLTSLRSNMKEMSNMPARGQKWKELKTHGWPARRESKYEKHIYNSCSMFEGV